MELSRVYLALRCLIFSGSYGELFLQCKKYPDIPDIRIFSVSPYISLIFPIKNIRMALGYPGDDIRIRLVCRVHLGAAAAPGLWLRRILGELLVWVLPG